MHRVVLPAMEDRSLAKLLPIQAAHQPDAIWLRVGQTHHTFGDADRRVDGLAAGLGGAGIGRGDRVAVILENSADHIFVVLALLRLGAIEIPVNTAYKGEFLARLLDDARPRAIIVDEAFVVNLNGALPDSGVDMVIVRGNPTGSAQTKLLSLEELRQGGTTPVTAGVSPTDCVTVSYTSGTTGRAKGVILSHNYWYLAAEAMSQGRGIQQDDVFHLCTPMFHAGAWLLAIYPSLLHGLTVGVDSWFSVGDYWQSVRDYGATQLFTLGAMHMWLWNLPRQESDSDTPARVWTTVPLAGELWEPFKDRYGLEAIFSAYGQTEIMPATTSDVRRRCKPGSAGWAQENLELRVVDDLDNPVPDDVAGELVVRPKSPDCMFQGYFNMPLETLEALRNLWYHTGDIVRIDEDGELFFVDRKADYLRRRGENISTIEVEEVVRKHPPIADAAVHGVPAEDAEDEVKLWVVVREGEAVDMLDLARYCAANLPYFAVPRYIETIDSLPRTPTGRVQKFLLRERGITPDTWDRVAAGFRVERDRPGRSDHPAEAGDGTVERQDALR
jgi:crotonobetaine/carnitine-CoA ligase